MDLLALARQKDTSSAGNFPTDHRNDSADRSSNHCHLQQWVFLSHRNHQLATEVTDSQWQHANLGWSTSFTIAMLNGTWEWAWGCGLKQKEFHISHFDRCSMLDPTRVRIDVHYQRDQVDRHGGVRLPIHLGTGDWTDLFLCHNNDEHVQFAE